MNIAVLGSGGRTGRKVVEQARARGHVVQGLQRSALAGDIAGDATDPARLRELVAGKDAVIVTLGPSATGPEDTCSRATEALVVAMKAAGCPRLVCLTGAMIGHPRERLSWMFRAMEASFPKLRAQLEERRVQERTAQRSGLNWTLVRPPRLADGPAVPARVEPDAWIGPFASISRDTLASVLVDAAEGRWSCQGVTVLPGAR